ncbi:hypothetical protein SAMN06297251_10142 [Fulvimarina manganoxydans]|uniref:Uncharacterized protein n=1 Tax=Fulvimarina manganoxydans TaxID=937218 RepID=A0A1W1Y8N9_9HYPH|nr:hypothetical protein [Fulvimarina manganoxydans]SMC32505.1 hypothetical protein SAMN06297251_10142 [Fulvimarina manganoxydans]
MRGIPPRAAAGVDPALAANVEALDETVNGDGPGAIPTRIESLQSNVFTRLLKEDVVDLVTLAPAVISAVRVSASATNYDVLPAAPANATHVYFVAVSGGASGCATIGTTAPGSRQPSGGAPGRVARSRMIPLVEVAAAQTKFALTIGAGGAAATASSGTSDRVVSNAGGDTTVSSPAYGTLRALGGRNTPPNANTIDGYGGTTVRADPRAISEQQMPSPYPRSIPGRGAEVATNTPAVGQSGSWGEGPGAGGGAGYSLNANSRYDGIGGYGGRGYRREDKDHRNDTSPYSKDGGYPSVGMGFGYASAGGAGSSSDPGYYGGGGGGGVSMDSNNSARNGGAGGFPGGGGGAAAGAVSASTTATANAPSGAGGNGCVDIYYCRLKDY